MRRGITTAGITVDTAAIAAPRHIEKYAERTLMLGWNTRADHRLRAQPLRRAGVAPDHRRRCPGIEDEVAAMQLPGSNLQIEFGVIDTTHRPTLEGSTSPPRPRAGAGLFGQHEPQPQTRNPRFK
jgi:hypothetical protein